MDIKLFTSNRCSGDPAIAVRVQNLHNQPICIVLSLYIATNIFVFVLSHIATLSMFISPRGTLHQKILNFGQQFMSAYNTNRIFNGACAGPNAYSMFLHLALLYIARHILFSYSTQHDICCHSRGIQYVCYLFFIAEYMRALAANDEGSTEHA